MWPRSSGFLRDLAQRVGKNSSGSWTPRQELELDFPPQHRLAGMEQSQPAGVGASGRMNRLRMTAVSTILLTTNLSHWLARWACFVDHSVLSLALSNLCPNHGDLFLRYANRLVTPGTEITAQSETSTDKSLECLGLRRHLWKNLS